jgi:hypothetical protein
MKRNGMGLGMLLTVCLLLSVMALTATAASRRFQETIGLDSRAVTNEAVALSTYGEPIDRVSVWNESTNTAVTVQVQLYDEYVAVNVYSNTLAARASDTQYPRRFDVMNQSGSAVSNAVPYYGMRLRTIVAVPQTNLAPTTVRGAVVGSGGAPPL